MEVNQKRLRMDKIFLKESKNRQIRIVLFRNCDKDNGKDKENFKVSQNLFIDFDILE